MNFGKLIILSWQQSEKGKNMTAKEYLSRIRTLDIIISQKEKELHNLRIMATGIGSSATDSVRVKSSPRSDALENRVIRMVELSEEIDKAVDAYVDERTKIVNEIHELNNPVHIEILYKRYVEYKKLEDVAIEMDYEYSSIRRLHGRALQEFAKKFIKVDTQCNI